MEKATFSTGLWILVCRGKNWLWNFTNHSHVKIKLYVKGAGKKPLFLKKGGDRYHIIYTYSLGPDSEARQWNHLIKKWCLSSTKSDWKLPPDRLTLIPPAHQPFRVNPHTLYPLSPQIVYTHYSFSGIFMLHYRSSYTLMPSLSLRDEPGESWGSSFLLDWKYAFSSMLRASPKWSPSVIPQNVHDYTSHFRVGERREDA